MKRKHIIFCVSVLLSTTVWIVFMKVWVIYKTPDKTETMVETTTLGVPIDFNVSSITISYNEMAVIDETKQQLNNETIEEALPTEAIHLNSSELLSNSTRTNNILILVVLTSNDVKEYGRALATMKCYAGIHNYSFIVAFDIYYQNECTQPDKFFRRHCVVAKFLPKYDYVLYLDADMGILNPHKKIEDYIDPRFDIIFYDRFYNQEVVAGAFLLKNSAYTRDFLEGFSNYLYKLPDAFHGTDNGALHAYILSKLFPDRPEDYKICIELYNMSVGFDELFAYEACFRAILGVREEQGNLKFMRKGTGYARDAWLTNSLWNPQRDFIVHGWKKRYFRKYSKDDLPIKPTYFDRAHWYDPIIGLFDYDKCVPGNYSWNYDPNLIAPLEVLTESLNKYRAEVDIEKFERLGYIMQKIKKVKWEQEEKKKAKKMGTIINSYSFFFIVLYYLLGTLI